MSKLFFSEEVKANETIAHNGYCRVEGCTSIIHSFHHRFPNTKVNQIKFPLFLQSQFNCAGLCFHHHSHYTMVPGLRITESEAEVYEEYLRKKGGIK